MGDKCRPKYFGARKLYVNLGEKKEVKFYWQEDHTKYFSECLTNGLFYVQNNAQLNWVHIARSKTTASLNPSPEHLYSSVSYLTMAYKGVTKLLEISIYKLYSIPTPPLSSQYPLISSDFTTLSDVWLPATSKFKFSDRY